MRSITSSNGSTNTDRPTSPTCLPLCNEHHHLVHDAGWHLSLQPDRTITLRRPDGTVAYHGSSIDVAPTGLTPTAPDTPDGQDALTAALARVAERFTPAA